MAQRQPHPSDHNSAGAPQGGWGVYAQQRQGSYYYSTPYQPPVNPYQPYYVFQQGMQPGYTAAPPRVAYQVPTVAYQYAGGTMPVMYQYSTPSQAPPAHPPPANLALPSPYSSSAQAPYGAQQPAAMPTVPTAQAEPVAAAPEQATPAGAMQIPLSAVSSSQDPESVDANLDVADGSPPDPSQPRAGGEAGWAEARSSTCGDGDEAPDAAAAAHLDAAAPGGVPPGPRSHPWGASAGGSVAPAPPPSHADPQQMAQGASHMRAPHEQYATGAPPHAAYPPPATNGWSVPPKPGGHSALPSGMVSGSMHLAGAAALAQGGSGAQPSSLPPQPAPSPPPAISPTSRSLTGHPSIHSTQSTVPPHSGLPAAPHTYPAASHQSQGCHAAAHAAATHLHAAHEPRSAASHFPAHCVQQGEPPGCSSTHPCKWEAPEAREAGSVAEGSVVVGSMGAGSVAAEQAHATSAQSKVEVEQPTPKLEVERAPAPADYGRDGGSAAGGDGNGRMSNGGGRSHKGMLDRASDGHADRPIVIDEDEYEGSGEDDKGVPDCDRTHQPWALSDPRAHQPWAPCAHCLAGGGRR